MTATQENFFKPGSTAAEAKAAQTTSTAQEIISAEAQARDLKTKRLRALRLALPVASKNKRNRRRN
ncbi:hypothetical protein [Rhizobium sp. BK251]|uniref:hypothetical protein n=1 Tax=Rhizobium sp. BK251 TaxID=2512125 RepID=UPI00104F9DA0|nr:hypothetical protein [Rhizobium sp. BK251]